MQNIKNHIIEIIITYDDYSVHLYSNVYTGQLIPKESLVFFILKNFEMAAHEAVLAAKILVAANLAVLAATPHLVAANEDLPAAKILVAANPHLVAANRLLLAATPHLVAANSNEQPLAEWRFIFGERFTDGKASKTKLPVFFVLRATE